MDVRGTRIQGTPAFYVAGGVQAPARRASYGTYVASADGWLFPAYYPFGLAVLNDLRVAYGVLELDEGALDHERALGASMPAPPGPEFFPEDFQPFAHQIQGIQRVRTWLRTWFQWDMGTGKTRTVLDGLRALRAEGKFKRALIVGPPVVMAGWLRETRRTTRGEWVAVQWDGTPEAARAAQTADIVLVTYTRCYLACQFQVEDPLVGVETLHAPERSPLLELGYDTFVADESHILGNPDSKPTTAALALASRAVRRILLTGTPGETPGKIYTQVQFLAPWLLPYSWHEFQRKFYVYETRGPRKVLVGYRGLDEINAAVNAIATRIKKADCLDLPDQVVVDVTFDLGSKQRARYNELVATMRASDTPDSTYLQPADSRVAVEEVRPALFQLPHGAARVNKLLQLVSGFLYDRLDTSVCDACLYMQACVAAGIQPYTRECRVFPRRPDAKVIRDVENPKLEAFRELLETILGEDPTNKVLCWGCFTPEIDDMMRVAKDLGVKAVRLDGSSTHRIGEIETAIQEDPECRVLAGAISAAVGINLQQANYTIVYTLPWKPQQYDQALERNNRPGQRRKMTVYRLLSSTASGVAIDRFVEGAFRFKKKVGFTMSELIACAPCENMEACHQSGTLPFGQGCKYAATATRTIAKVEEL